MRKAFMLMFLVNLVLIAVSLQVLPEKIASNFGADGMANSWGNNISINIIMFISADLPIFLMFLFAGNLVILLPKKMVNMPHRDYWFMEEHKEQMKRMLESVMSECGLVLLTFMVMVRLMTIDANLRKPAVMNDDLFIPIVIVFFGYIVYWCAKVLHMFTKPKYIK